MLEQARQLAARGHYSLMIEAVLRANGFPEAAEWIDHPHIHNELKNIADRARKEAVGLSRKTGTMRSELGNEPIKFRIPVHCNQRRRSKSGFFKMRAVMSPPRPPC